MAADLTMGKLNVNVWTVCYNMDNVTFIRAVSTIDLGGFCMIFSVEQEPTNERPVWWWLRSNEVTVLRCQSVQYKQLDQVLLAGLGWAGGVGVVWAGSDSQIIVQAKLLPSRAQLTNNCWVVPLTVSLSPAILSGQIIPRYFPQEVFNVSKYSPRIYSLTRT